MTFNYRAPGATKHQKEQRRAERRQAKAERLTQRRADKLKGIVIDDLPVDYQGLARFLTSGDVA